MGVSVTKEGPYFAGGGGQTPNNQTNMKFSQMRDVFKLDLKGSSASGSSATSIIKASELRRNVDNNARDPYVPDAVINEDISSSNNWKVSQMRSSIKRFWATQSGTDTNFKMGRYNGSEGIDWGGYGSGGRDSTSSGNGNLTKNVQKFVKIEGTCGANDSGVWGGQNQDPGAGSWTPGAPAAQLRPVVPARNVRIWVYGSILGAGGEGGYDGRGYNAANNRQNGADPGTPGGTALGIDHSGNNTEVVIKSGSARIYGGGGGGEQGMNGAIPEIGQCIKEYTLSGCGSAPACSPGVQIGPIVQGSCCNEGEYCWSRFWGGEWCNEYCNAYTKTRTCKDVVDSTLPAQGIGGRGGNGQGYNLSRSNGSEGTNPSEKCPTCNPGYTLNAGKCTDAGRRGGNGGSWGQAGESTTANNALHQPQPSTGGRAGRAICGSNYTVAGTVNGNTVKGTYSGQCDGSTSVSNCSSPIANITKTGTGPWTLSWNVTGTAPFTVTGSSSPNDSSWNPTTTSGSVTVNPGTSTTYVINVSNNCGASQDQMGIGYLPPTWTVTRSASWQLQTIFNKYQGQGQQQIVSTRTSDGSSTQGVNAYGGSKYRMRHRCGTYPSWLSGDNDAKNLSETSQRGPVFKLSNSTTLRLEDGSSHPNNGNYNHPDSRNWEDFKITTDRGTFSVDGQTDWPLYIDGLHSRNESRASWLAITGGTTINWYKTPNESDWSSFMNEYAVYREPQNDPQVGTHTYQGIITISTAGKYYLAWACDNSGTITFNGNTTSHNSFINVKTEVYNFLAAGDYPITFTVTNDSHSNNNWTDNPGGMAIRMYDDTSNNNNVWSTRDDVAGTSSSSGGTTSDQRIELWDGTNPDANAWFYIVSKDSTITEAKFVDGGRKLRIKGGGNITLELGWDDNPGDAGVAMNWIDIFDWRWTRSGGDGDQRHTMPICGGDIIYSV